MTSTTNEPLHDEETCLILDEIWLERGRQDEKWGEQNHANGTGGEEAEKIAASLKSLCKSSEPGEDTWVRILAEEVSESLAETERDLLRMELIQTAAVVVAWIECLDRTASK